MVEAQVLLPFPVQSDHHFHQINYLALNPNAPEFYPFYYITPPNYNTTIITTNNFHIIPDYYYSHDHYYPYYSPPLPPPFSVPPPPTVQLPHHHFHPRNVNFQEYPSSYFTPIDHHPQILHSSSNPTHYHHNYQYNLPSNPNDITMQPQPLPKPQLAGPGHIRGPVSTRARPKRVYFHNDHHRATVAVTDGVKREPSSGSDGNKGEKEGLISSKEEDDDDDDQGRGIFGRRGKLTEVIAVKPGGSETTAMIRNIPNQYTRAMLVKFLDEFCNKENQKLKEATDDHHPPLFAFDFLYLPMDFKTNANKGYAFVNFTHPSAVWKLHLACSDRAWEYCQSPKICQIAYASVQGKQKLVRHFGETIFICSHEEYLPVCFRPPRDGSGVPVKLTTVGIRISLPSDLTR